MSTQTTFLQQDPEFHPDAFTVQFDLAAFAKALARGGSRQFPLEIVTYMEGDTGAARERHVVHRRVAYAEVLDNGAIVIDVSHLPNPR